MMDIKILLPAIQAGSTRIIAQDRIFFCCSILIYGKKYLIFSLVLAICEPDRGKSSAACQSTSPYFYFRHPPKSKSLWWIVLIKKNRVQQTLPIQKSCTQRRSGKCQATLEGEKLWLLDSLTSPYFYFPLPSRFCLYILLGHPSGRQVMHPHEEFAV